MEKNFLKKQKNNFNESNYYFMIFKLLKQWLFMVNDI